MERPSSSHPFLSSAGDETMGKGISDWHRQKRKKELQKNKEARISQRDEKVKQEKSFREVQAEISKLERQYKDENTRPHAIKSKLDRLRKELKLVKEAENECQKDQPSVKKGKSATETFKPLENPAISVYYDKVLNPFGVPPPGKPKLYHKFGGGTTMNMDEAVDPSRPHELAVKKPVREAPKKTKENAPREELRKENRTEPTEGNQKHSSEPKKLEDSASSQQQQSEKEKIDDDEPNPKKVIDPSQLPSLPKPSAAVERLKRKRKNMTADIWASTEEVEYEEQVGLGSLEGLSRPEHEWWYKDQSGVIQGPYPKAQVVEWVRGGFFPADTLMRPSPDDAWKQLQNLAVFFEALPDRSKPKKEKKRKKSTVQDRIAALKAQKDAQEGDENSVQARIAALRGDAPKSQEAQRDEAVESSRNEESSAFEEFEDSIPPPPLQLPCVQGAEPEIDDDMPPPPPPPAVAQVAPYPTDHDIPDYPAYPIDEEMVAYPVGDEFVSDQHPDQEMAVSAYSMIEQVQATDEEGSALSSQKVKKVKTDKALVSLLPATLATKRK